jgi:hypothetical protein
MANQEHSSFLLCGIVTIINVSSTRSLFSNDDSPTYDDSSYPALFDNQPTNLFRLLLELYFNSTPVTLPFNIVDINNVAQNFFIQQPKLD